MKEQITDQIRIRHVLDAITEVENYLLNISYDQYIASSEKRFATIKQIEIIGEACNHISAEIKQTHAEVDWWSINGFRNISIHEYFSVNFRIVWEIAQNDLPLLKQSFAKVLATL